MQNELYYDVAVIGAGTSGLYTALSLTDDYATTGGYACKVAVFSKKSVLGCSSALAQGGIAAVLDDKNDRFDLHYNDSLIAGGFENNPAALRVLVESAPDEISRLVKYGAELDKDRDGNYSLGLEGGHSRRRIVHVKDRTGLAVVNALWAAANARDNIKVFENAPVSDIIKGDGYYAVCTGTTLVYAKYVVMATGGIGKLWKYSTNSDIATGDGIYLAAKLGADIKQLSYIQFHPTGFKGGTDGRVLLISEAVRGDGGILLNGDYERFMDKYDSRKELAPRDVVSRSILAEQNAKGNDKFYIDISHKDPDWVMTRFPFIYGEVLKNGYDITREPIPIYPCQHYLMGGIAVDEDGETDTANLFATGECACTGVHGRNRLASNSLLEALVFPHRIADTIKKRGFDVPVIKDIAPPRVTDTNENIEAIQELMQKAFFVNPNIELCKQGYNTLDDTAISFCAKRIFEELING